MFPDFNAVPVSLAQGSGRVLVVDDDPDLRQMVSSLLESEGFEVVNCSTGGDAIRHLSQGTFDLALLDLWLPDINGLDLLTHFRDSARTTKFIVTTADSTPENLLRAIREQAYQYIRKPVSNRELVDIVRASIAAPPATTIEIVSAKPEWVELSIPCTQEAVDRLGYFMDQLKGDLDPELRNAVAQAFRELMLNAVEWGGHFDPTRSVRIAYIRTKRMLQYRIADPGQGFCFQGLSHSAICNPSDNPLEHTEVRERAGLRSGGLGLLMVRSIADELIFNEAQNEVLFVKYLG